MGNLICFFRKKKIIYIYVSCSDDAPRYVIYRIYALVSALMWLFVSSLIKIYLNENSYLERIYGTNKLLLLSENIYGRFKNNIWPCFRSFCDPFLLKQSITAAMWLKAARRREGIHSL